MSEASYVVRIFQMSLFAWFSNTVIFPLLNVFFFLKEILIHYRWKVTFDAVTSLMCTIYVFFLCPAKQTIPSSEYGTTAILQFHCRNNVSEGFQLTAAIWKQKLQLCWHLLHESHFNLFLTAFCCTLSNFANFWRKFKVDNSWWFPNILSSVCNEMILCWCSAAEKNGTFLLVLEFYYRSTFWPP